MTIIDIFTHILPEKFHLKVNSLGLGKGGINKRTHQAVGVMNLDDRFRVMDHFGDYRQIINLVAPPIESYGPPPLANDLARLANDEMANMVHKYPHRFPGFAASLPMNDPEGMIDEARRAVTQLGAVGVQVFSNVNGKPLDRPETMPLFDLMAELDRPVWIHPIRAADFADYKEETKSRYEIWWCFGWAYETSAAMAHLVFSGLFDRHPEIKIITHHLGGMIPYMEGKIGPGWDVLGSRTTDEDYGQLLRGLKKRPLDYFHMFYADTAIFGSKLVAECGYKFFGAGQTLFGSDAPMGPKETNGWMGMCKQVVDELDITDGERRAIFSDNAKRLLKLN